MNIEKLKTMDLRELPDLPVSEEGAPYVVLDEFGKGPYFVTSEKFEALLAKYIGSSIKNYTVDTLYRRSFYCLPGPRTELVLFKEAKLAINVAIYAFFLRLNESLGIPVNRTDRNIQDNS